MVLDDFRRYRHYGRMPSKNAKNQYIFTKLGVECASTSSDGVRHLTPSLVNMFWCFAFFVGIRLQCNLVENRLTQFFPNSGLALTRCEQNGLQSQASGFGSRRILFFISFRSLSNDLCLTINWTHISFR